MTCICIKKVLSESFLQKKSTEAEMSRLVTRLWLCFLIPPLNNLFIKFSNILVSKITEETLIVEMLIWCRKWVSFNMLLQITIDGY